MLDIDHVIIGVADLDTAAERFEREYGLRSLRGGRHPGHGTGNRIIPLGAAYLELMAVVDAGEAAGSPLGSWLRRRVGDQGDGVAAVCLGTDDVAAAKARTGRMPQAMSRTRPDGIELAWDLIALDAALDDGLPFFVNWRIDPADHPGRMPIEHAVPAAGLEWVELAGDADRLDAWLGPHELPFRIVEGTAPGPHRVAIANADGDPIVIDG